MVRYLATEYALGNIVTEAVEAAAEAGHLHVLKWLHDDFTGTALFGMREIYLAAENGHLEVLQWLYEHSGPSAVLAVESMTNEEQESTVIDPVFRCRVPRNENLLMAAGSRGHLHVLRWLATEIDKWARAHDEGRSTKYVYVRNRTACNGHLDVLMWLQSVKYDWLSVAQLSRQVTVQVIENGHLEVAKWAWTHQRWTFVAPAFFIKAAANDRLDMMQWVLGVEKFEWPASAIVSAASAGHLVVLRWLQEECQGDRARRIDISRWFHRRQREKCSVPDAMDKAAANGHLDVVKFLHDQPFAKRKIATGCTTAAMDGAAENGHAAVVEWLSRNRREGCTVATMNGAASNGHLDIVKWLHERRSEGCTAAAMNGAAKGGHLDVVKWLHVNRSEGSTAAAMDGAASGGHLDVLQWLHANRSEGCTAAAIDGAASDGHLEVVQWLHENRSEGCTTSAINGAAGNGHLDVVRWLHKNRFEGCTSGAMDQAAKNGHLHVMRWLHENRSEGCSINATENAASAWHFETLLFLRRYSTVRCSSWAFVDAYKKGDLDLLRWLAFNYPEDFDPAFTRTFGYPQRAKPYVNAWLRSLQVN